MQFSERVTVNDISRSVIFTDMSVFLAQALHLKAFLPGTLAEIFLCHPHKSALASERLWMSIFPVLAPSSHPLLIKILVVGKANTYLKYINLLIQVKLNNCPFWRQRNTSIYQFHNPEFTKEWTSCCLSSLAFYFRGRLCILLLLTLVMIIRVY